MGLGSLKMHGKLDPRIMGMAILPHMRFGMPQSMGGRLRMLSRARRMPMRRAQMKESREMCFRQLCQESRWLASINDGRWGVLLGICTELARQRHFKKAQLVYLALET